MDEYAQRGYSAAGLAHALNVEAETGAQDGWTLVGVFPAPNTVHLVIGLWKREKPKPTPQEILEGLDLPPFVKGRSVTDQVYYDAPSNDYYDDGGRPTLEVTLVVARSFDVTKRYSTWRSVADKVSDALAVCGARVRVRLAPESRKRKVLK